MNRGTYYFEAEKHMTIRDQSNICGYFACDFIFGGGGEKSNTLLEVSDATPNHPSVKMKTLR
jgi:hypothetical protein